MLDERLRICAVFVVGKNICDVGTDHGYLPIYLLNENICEHAYACDINEKPLLSARNNLLKHPEISSKMEFILSNGLEKVPVSEISDIIIAGMGAELIADILTKGGDLRGKNLILQPMTNHAYLRNFLCENGFEIIKEKAVIDKNHSYVIINARFTGVKTYISETESYFGKLSFDDENSQIYLDKIANKMLKIYYSSGQIDKYILGYKLFNKIGGKIMTTANDIYKIVDKISPFEYVHGGDNSGFIVGDKSAEVKKALVTLDITRDVVLEAIEKKADIIISHHPVIYNPLYKLDDSSPACLAYKNNIALICSHSPLDMADGGINDIIFDMLGAIFSNMKKEDVLESIHPNGRGYGIVCSCDENKNSCEELAKKLKDLFGCSVVRYTKTTKPIRKIALCSGGSGGVAEVARQKGADAYIGGDFKHDIFIDARNNDYAIFDCGHFHTENIVTEYLIKKFAELLPDFEVEIAENSTDPAFYAL